MVAHGALRARLAAGTMAPTLTNAELGTPVKKEVLLAGTGGRYWADTARCTVYARRNTIVARLGDDTLVPYSAAH